MRFVLLHVKIALHNATKGFVHEKFVKCTSGGLATMIVGMCFVLFGCGTSTKRNTV